jgi:hypothetical protein
MKTKHLILILFLSAFVGTTACRRSTSNANTGVLHNSNVVYEPPPKEPATDLSQNADPEALVADLYKQHDSYMGPFFQTNSRPRVDKYFTKRLADLIWQDATTAKGAVGAIVADPVYGAESIEIKEFEVGKAAINGDTATVPVTFENFDAKQKVTFSLKKENDLWHIDDIRYSNGETLMGWLNKKYPAEK